MIDLAISAAAWKSGSWLLLAAVFVGLVYRNRAVLDQAAFLREIILIAAAYLAYFAVRGLTASSREQAIRNAGDVMSTERWLHLAHEGQLQRLIIDHHMLVTFANWAYIWGHWPLILFVSLWLWLKAPDTYRLYRNAFLISGGAALVIFALYPVAPPRFADDRLIDTVTSYSRSYRTMQPPAFVNQYAAMPSMHFGWNLLIGIAVATTARNIVARCVGVIVPAVMFLAIVLTANHYIIDGIAGAVVALTGLAAAYALRSAPTLAHATMARPRAWFHAESWGK